MATWAHEILLDGVDITERTASGATVDEGENVSHVSDIRYYPVTGIQDPDGLIGKTVKLSVDVGAGLQTIFSGAVIRAEWDQKQRLYRLRASNRIQEHFRAMDTHAAVLAAISGGVYSEALFGEPPDDLWEYAQQIEETVESDIHIDRTGALVQIPWSAKGTPDHVLAGAKVHNAGAFTLRRPDLDQTINRVVIEYQYRVTRHKTRAHSVGWSAWRNNTGIVDFCSWLVGASSREQFIMPTIGVVEPRMLGASWSAPAGVKYSTFPDSGYDICGAGSIWNRLDESHVLTASSTGYLSFSQPITETYTLTVEGVAAQGVYGTTVTDSRSGSAAIESDPAWPPSKAAAPDPAWSTDSIGDAYEDQDDEVRRSNDLQAGYQWAARRIRGSQRATSLVIRTDIDPTITLADTVEAQSYGLRAVGKVRQLRHILDSASPYLELTVALSRGGGGTTTPWVVPARPDTSDPGYPAPPSSTTLNTHVGGWPGADTQPVPEDRFGWITNVGSYICSPPGDPCPDPDQYYDSSFRVEWPEIEDEAAVERPVSEPSSWELSIDHDALEMT